MKKIITIGSQDLLFDSEVIGDLATLGDVVELLSMLKCISRRYYELPTEVRDQYYDTLITSTRDSISVRDCGDLYSESQWKDLVAHLKYEEEQRITAAAITAEDESLI